MSLALALIAASGCASNPPTPAPAASATPPAPAPVPPAANAPAAPVADSSFPVIPEGSVYTLWCMTITSPTHVPDSDTLKMQLIGRTNSNNWYVIHGDGQSTLYYGFYKTYSDKHQPDEVGRAQSEREFVATLRADNGDMPFARCVFVPLASPDPDAPPEWDLRHATGYWSLQIAAYRGSPERKKFAVDAVRAARASGVEAYYYHGPVISSVFIGSWPREAVKEQDQAVAQPDDPSKTLMVLNQPLPEGFQAENLHAQDGSPVQVVAPKVEILDPTLISAMKQYPANAVNGQVTVRKVPTDHGVEERPDPSFLVVIPHDDAGQ